MAPHTELPIHPRTGLRAIYVSERTGRVYWPILGASEPGAGGGGGEPAGGADAPAYTAPASQADLDRIIESRLSRERSKFADYDSLKERAERLDALELEMSTDVERAGREAADQAWTAAMSQAVPRVVRAEFRAEAKGVLTDEQLDELLDRRDLASYANDDGEPDLEQIKATIAKFAPQPSSHVNGRPTNVNPPRPLGQGNQPPVVPKPGERGRAEAAKRFQKPAAATT